MTRRYLSLRSAFSSLLLLSVAQLDADPVQWRLEDGGNGHFYEHVTVSGGVGWVAAESAAETRELLGVRGHLVTVTSPDEERFLVSEFSLAGVWVGLTDRRSEGNFEWITGEPVIFENWRAREPNNAGDEDFAIYIGTGETLGWNDSSDRRGNFVGDLDYSYIVEFPVLVGLFQRGNVNGDAQLDIADPVDILDFLFGPGAIECLEAGDVNNDGGLDISDAVGLLGFLFLGTLAPPPPFVDCGSDADADDLDCESFPLCE